MSTEAAVCIICQANTAEISTECCTQPYCIQCLYKYISKKNSCPTCRGKYASMGKNEAGEATPQARRQVVTPLRALPSLKDSICKELMKQAEAEFIQKYGPKTNGKRKVSHITQDQYHEVVETLAALYTALRNGRDKIFAKFQPGENRIRSVHVAVNEVDDGIMLALKAEFDTEGEAQPEEEEPVIPSNPDFVPAAKRRKMKAPKSFDASNIHRKELQL